MPLPIPSRSARHCAPGAWRGYCAQSRRTGGPVGGAGRMGKEWQTVPPPPPPHPSRGNLALGACGAAQHRCSWLSDCVWWPWGAMLPSSQRRQLDQEKLSAPSSKVRGIHLFKYDLSSHCRASPTKTNTKACHVPSPRAEAPDLTSTQMRNLPTAPP